MPKTGPYASWIDDNIIPGYQSIASILARLDALDQAGLLIHTRHGKVPRLKRYLQASTGQVPGNIWTDIPPLNSQARERTGWKTQKPLALLERIIKASSNEGDIVFDPFCGCGTSLVAAETLGRRWVGADDDANAVDVIRERIANLTGAVTDAPQMQHSISVLAHPPERTIAVAGAVHRDPTGYIIPKMPSDRMTNAQIREQLAEWQTESDGLITCIGCAERLRPRHFECDHIDARAQGGTNRIDNRILLCGACNGQKSSTKQLTALWAENGMKGAARRRMQGLLSEIRGQARALVLRMDTGSPAQGVF